MSYNPHGLFGSLNDNDLLQYNDTGAVLTKFDFNPRFAKVEKMGHVAAVGGGSPVPAQYRQIRQVQTYINAADMEASFEIMPDVSGHIVGLAAVAPGDAITFANFTDGGPAIHGFTRDATKLLLAGEIKQSRGPENPTEITLPATYYPLIAAP